MEKKLCLDISQTKGFYDEKLYNDLKIILLKNIIIFLNLLY